MSAPKVFISHASEDKDRFVVKFAQRLRENGVDAWLDQWEMKPGDSLVDKIFEQGLKEAQAVILVISAASIQKPWVREELNLSVVKKITAGLKLIPVVVDQCEIPQSLQSTIWQRIDDLNNYDDAFRKILDVIFDRSDKPPLGIAPDRYADAKPTLPSFTRTDERVLCAVAHHEIDLTEGFVSASDLHADPQLSDVTEEDLRDSLQILAQKNVLRLEPMGGDVIFAALTLPGFIQYAQGFVPDYQQTLAQIAGLLINENIGDNKALATRLGKPQPFVNYVLDVLADAKHIVLSKYGSGLWDIVEIAPSLKRTLA